VDGRSGGSKGGLGARKQGEDAEAQQRHARWGARGRPGRFVAPGPSVQAEPSRPFSTISDNQQDREALHSCVASKLHLGQDCRGPQSVHTPHLSSTTHLDQFPAQDRALDVSRGVAGHGELLPPSLVRLPSACRAVRACTYAHGLHVCAAPRAVLCS